MPLSDEDNLRLNVLLTQDLYAVRIDESSLCVHALTARGEARIALAPNEREEKYLRLVRELLSTHAFGSPGGYPVFIKRWTRMGQTRTENLHKLLLLGEPEAVAAVVYANGLTDELARRAWWVQPSAEHARRMLEREPVAQGGMGAVLAAFLLEFLPFEEDPRDMLDSIRLVLQPGLISAEARQNLWKRASTRNTYYVGFLAADPDALPDPLPAHPQCAAASAQLAALVAAGNPYAAQLCRVLSPAGQTFLRTAAAVMRKPNNQDVVLALIELVEQYFRTVRPTQAVYASVQELLAAAQAHAQGEGVDAALGAVLDCCASNRDWIEAMLVLSFIGEPLLAPIFARSDAIGSVMRKKIEPVTGPVLERFACLLGA